MKHKTDIRSLAGTVQMLAFFALIKHFCPYLGKKGCGAY